ncbi:AEC family transporter [Meridianimarinicoccus roseus]|uniref:AEC family transporter n=1 Tax=Meridianimarinicoccus roseus TaxID=2072018 RepID=A0A2V2LDF9_9RHOB|nr:AEC family transporter [Meridianimarinicoccus roseus]PWR03568.1 AEC family transporter [Meridianimarinicoccus roseus]
MAGLIEVVLPVFLVIGFGYVAVSRGLFSDAGVDGLMRFTQKFAIPCLLFQAMSTLDLGLVFDWRLLVSFYTGAISGFVLGLFGARYLFGRPWTDAVAIGFCCLFSNSLLLGVPISERAYGTESLASNFAIISIHSPVCYMIGITAMEIVRNKGGSGLGTVRAILKAMFSNALIIGIALGIAVNLSGFVLPVVLTEAVALMVRAALPAALFGLGGVLVRYRPEGDMRTIGFVVLVSLVVHPAITWAMGSYYALQPEAFRAAVLTGAMAPGVNAYVFADMYGSARRVAASSVLAGTAATVLTAWAWLHLLG